MTVSDAYCEAMTAIHEASTRYRNGTITIDQAREEHAAIMEVYDDQVSRIRNAELAKHTHDFVIP